MAFVGDGVYSAKGSDLTLDSGPQATRTMVERLRKAAEAARAGAITRDELLAELSGVSPEFAAKVGKFGAPTFLLILLAFWIIKSISLNITVDLNKLFDQAYNWSQGVDPTAHEPLRDAPEPDFNAASPDGGTPEEAIFSPTIVAAYETAPMSRQVKRRLARNQKKRSA